MTTKSKQRIFETSRSLYMTSQWILVLTLFSTKAFAFSNKIISTTVPTNLHKKSHANVLTVFKHTAFYSSSSSDLENISDTKSPQTETNQGKPLWMKCVNGVAPRTGAINDAISRLSDVTLEQANELIRIGAVWARFDAQDTYEQSLNEWGYSMKNENEDDYEEMDLDEYIARLEYESNYQRVLEPQIIQAGTDLRIYPHPRRFAACYKFTKERLLYEDTTFIVVDKPPMLPTQPDASNYLECCPGCVNDLLGPFETLDGEAVERPLLCHRVDSCVGGCVVLSKDKNGQKVFAEFQVCFHTCRAFFLFTHFSSYLLKSEINS